MIWTLALRFWKPIAIGAAVLCIALAVRGYGEHHEQIGYKAGVAAQVAADDKASAELHRRVAALTAENQRLAAEAHETYEAEHAHTLLSVSLPVRTRELCKPADAHAGGGDVPRASTAHPGDEAQPATAGMVREMPAPDHGLALDRRRLLGALAGLADEQPAVIREYQARATGEEQRAP